MPTGTARPSAAHPGHGDVRPVAAHTTRHTSSTARAAPGGGPGGGSGGGGGPPAPAPAAPPGGSRSAGARQIRPDASVSATAPTPATAPSGTTAIATQRRSTSNRPR